MKAIAAGLTNLINNPTALAGIENGLAPTDAAPYNTSTWIPC